MALNPITTRPSAGTRGGEVPRAPQATHAPPPGRELIELRDVGVQLGGRVLFENVNLNLQAGERLGIVGRNGLGKSSLLRVMLGQLAPASGEVEIGARTRLMANLYVEGPTVIGEDNVFGNLDDALDRARQHLGLAPAPHPAFAEPTVEREKVSRVRSGG